MSILVVVLVIALSWWQAAARRQGTRSPVERLLLEILSPSVRLAAAARDLITPDPNASADGFPPVGVARLKQLETENAQLRALLALRDGLPKGAVAAEVIGRSINPWQGSLLLGKGSADGIAPHMMAITPEGVLGQVATVTKSTADLLLLTDPASGIGAMIERTRETGVLKGYREGKCLLVYLSDQADVQVGDMVVTSGLSEFYPKGFLLGKVESVTDDPALSSRSAIVIPAANPATAELVMVAK